MFDPKKSDEPRPEEGPQEPVEQPAPDESDAAETSADAISAEETSGDETSGDETSGDETSGDETSADAIDAAVEEQAEVEATDADSDPEPEVEPEAGVDAEAASEPETSGPDEALADPEATAVRPAVAVEETDSETSEAVEEPTPDDTNVALTVPVEGAEALPIVEAEPAPAADEAQTPDQALIPAEPEPEPAVAEQSFAAQAATFEESAPVTERPRRRGRKAVLWTAAGAVVLGGAYAALHQVAAGRVPQGTTVAGTDIGGTTADEAWTALESAFAERGTAPIDVTVDTESTEIDPTAAGLAFDHDATLAKAGVSDSWAPTTIIGYFTGGTEVEPVVTVDPDRLSTLLDRVDADHGTKVREGKVRFEGADIVTVEPRTGKVVDRAEAEETLRTAFVSEDRSVELAVLPTEPEIDAADVTKAVTEVANPAVSDSVTLTSGDVEVVLQPSEYTAAIKFVPVAGELQPQLRPKKLTELVDAALEENGGPKEASVALVNGTPTVVPDELGIAFDEVALQDVFLDVVTRPAGERSVEVKSVEVRSEFTTEDAKNLNIVEEVSNFTTRFPAAAYRFTNIGRAAELIDGTVLKPGEVFSLNETVGERTAANGFTTGIMIADGVFKEDFGGGVSQMATTLFNAMFFAGLEDVEHKPHSFYISRYPEGREATVAWGSIDLRFRNNTDHGILIKASVTPAGGEGLVNVTMWSTKVWDITTSKSPRYAFTSPKTRTLTGDSCQPNSGSGGFDVDVKRYFHKPGDSAVVKTENFHTTYTPADRVICE